MIPLTRQQRQDLTDAIVEIGQRADTVRGLAFAAEPDQDVSRVEGQAMVLITDTLLVIAKALCGMAGGETKPIVPQARGEIHGPDGMPPS